jgi:hypothetical protein
MIDHGQRVNGLVKGSLKKYALAKGASVGFNVVQGFGPIVGPDSQIIGTGPVWFVTVTLKNPIIGQRDISHMFPIPGTMPSDHVFESVARDLLNECLDDESKLMSGNRLPTVGEVMSLNDRPN